MQISRAGVKSSSNPAPGSNSRSSGASEEERAMDMAMRDNSRDEKEVADGIRVLLEWAVSVKLEDIPRPILRKAVIVMADNICAMIAARTEPQVQQVQQKLLREGGHAEATVFLGGRQRIGRISAALINGIAGSWCELDEGYRLATLPRGPVSLP